MKYDDNRPWRHLYNRKEWKALRRDQLTKEPLCRYCQQQGKVEAATVADHIVPHKGDEALFFDADNLQSLCATHHDASKQKAEKRGVAEVGSDTTGAPLDPSHHWNR
ncbi:HNH endonuclease [Marinobacter sp. NSM]|uniref:HNH endonuclease n=1 Tax=Marinobacter sp. NSM TaxID=3458004 RepID=UPI004036E229